MNRSVVAGDPKLFSFRGPVRHRHVIGVSPDSRARTGNKDMGAIHADRYRPRPAIPKALSIDGLVPGHPKLVTVAIAVSYRCEVFRLRQAGAPARNEHAVACHHLRRRR
jgi:hypothetical protein